MCPSRLTTQIDGSALRNLQKTTEKHAGTWSLPSTPWENKKGNMVSKGAIDEKNRLKKKELENIDSFY
jgi:hypothetical protein